tara:strand:+ start:4167 stop:5189 length:1023 start_codon:yes stop_codon:yes gene_type:complete
MSNKKLKKTISLFLRKPIEDKNFSVENFYYDLFKKFKHKNLEICIKVCPLKSTNVFNRVFLCFWAFFNQGSINHICGDVNFISIFLNKNKTINTILDCYSMKRLKGIKRFIYKIFWIRVPYIKSSKIITISKKTLRDFNSFIISENTKKIDVIGVCVSDKFKKNFKSKINQIPKILIIGTAINKNIFNIISSLQNIKCETIIIGELKEKIIKKLKFYNLNYKNYVSLSKKKLVNKYKECDLLLYPSKFEGFGMPIIEAQSIGRPVITSKFEPMKSVAGNGALYVNPNSIKEISNGVKLVLKNKKLRNSIIKKGFINIKKYKPEVILNKHYRVYEDVLNNL